MSSLFWVVSQEAYCVSHTNRSDIHCARFDQNPGTLTSPPRASFRALCGVDIAHPHAIASADGNGNVHGHVVMPWPPPADRRCPTCDQLTRTPSGRDRQPKGADLWQQVKPKT